MNPAQRQTAERILFTRADQLTEPFLHFHMSLHKKLAQIDQFFGGCPRDLIQKNSLVCQAYQASRDHIGLLRHVDDHCPRLEL